VSSMPGKRSMDGKRRDFDRWGECPAGEDVSCQDDNDQFEAKEKSRWQRR